VLDGAGSNYQLPRLAIALDDVSMWLAYKIFEIAQMADGKALNMREFSFAAQASPAAARTVLQTLLKLKLVAERRVRQGATEIAEIRLTQAGLKVSRHVAAIDALLPPED